jgi:CheY-like chemotaxis protein
MVSAPVLYVEDEENDALFMRMAFGKAGLDGKLRVVADGREAINYLAGRGAYGDRVEHPLPMLILLDLNLPIVSGFEVLKWVRQQAAFQSLPVVVFSSSVRKSDKQTALELGANEYVEKPSSALEFPKVLDGLKKRWLATHA